MTQPEDELLAELRGLQGVFVRGGEMLARHSNLRLGGEADLYVVVDEPGALGAVMAVLKRGRGTVRVSSGFLDLVAWDEGLSGALVRLGTGFDWVRAEDGGLRAGAALPLARLGLAARDAGLEGLSALVDWPGTVGSWIDAAGLARLRPALREIVLVTGRGRKTLAGDEIGTASSGGSAGAVGAAGGPVPVEALFGDATAKGLFRPSPPGAVASLDAAFEAIFRQSGLCGVRLRGLRLAPEAPGVVVNLGSGTPRDLDLLFRLVKERLYRDHGLEFDVRISFASRPTSRRSPGGTREIHG
jgi:UDP-N-acetylenolpyruvoylglucosamine reductase